MELTTFREWAEHFRWADVLDIVAVALLCYFGLSWLRRNASRSLLIATVLVLLLYSGARLFDLYLTSRIFQAGALVIVVAMLIIFQDDLRRAAERFAFRGVASADRKATSISTLDVIVETVSELAEARVGALFVFPGREPLDRHTRGGERLGGVVSRSLLVSLFHPGSPGHDGAAIVEGDRLTRFAVHLPLSRFPDRVGREGTRHSAAVGLAENSDALVVVVSEERGTISVARRGALEVVKPAELKDRLNRFLAESAPQPASRAVAHWVLRDPALKLTAALLAFLLWLGIAFRVETVQRQFVAPIEYRNLPAGWAIAEPRPTQARITLSGTERNFDRFDPSGVIVSLDLSQPSEGPLEFAVTEGQISGIENLDLLDVDPQAVQLTTYRVATLSLPVQVRVRNEPPEGLKLARIEARPSLVLVQAPAAQADTLSEIETETIDLSRFRRSGSIRLRLNLPPRVRLLENQPAIVEATVHLEPAAKEKPDSK